jgi:hypothetical protein
MNPPPASDSDELETAMIVQRAFADEMRAEIESIRKSEAMLEKILKCQSCN